MNTETTNTTMNFKKPYVLRNKKNGKYWRQAINRAEARALKKAKNFMYEIVNTTTMKVVR